MAGPTHPSHSPPQVPPPDFFGGMDSSSAPVDNGDARWEVILASPRESDLYIEAIRGLLSSKRERELVRDLDNDSAKDRLLDIFDLESQEGTSKFETKKEQEKCFMLLQKMCKRYARLPSSYMIGAEVTHEGSAPWVLSAGGDVWKARYKGRLVALKYLKMFQPQEVQSGSKKLQDLCSEALIWKRLSHPNIVPFLGAKRTTSGKFGLISEWMEHGTITEFVEENPRVNRLKLLHDVTSGLEYIHEQKLIHSDIKSGNVLIDRKFTARIGDFGLTGIIPNASNSMSFSSEAIGGTYHWMAPELLKNHNTGELQKSTKESDVYSFGMLAYEVFSHCKPFMDIRHDYKVVTEIIKGTRPARPLNREILGLDDEVWGKIQECWDPDPGARPIIKDVMSFLEPKHLEWTQPTLASIDASSRRGYHARSNRTGSIFPSITTITE